MDIIQYDLINERKNSIFKMVKNGAKYTLHTHMTWHCSILSWKFNQNAAKPSKWVCCGNTCYASTNFTKMKRNKSTTNAEQYCSSLTAKIFPFHWMRLHYQLFLWFGWKSILERSIENSAKHPFVYMHGSAKGVQSKCSLSFQMFENWSHKEGRVILVLQIFDNCAWNLCHKKIGADRNS